MRVRVQKLTPAEAWAQFDRASRRRLGIDADTFVARWDAGEYRDGPENVDVVAVAMLRPARPDH